MDIYFNDQVKRGTDYVMNQIQVGVLVLKKTGQEELELSFFNDAFCRLLEYDRSELETILRRNLWTIIYPADREKVLDAIRRMDLDETQDWSFRLVDKQKNASWFLGHYKESAYNKEDYIFISVTNIQEYVSANNQLGLSENKWSDIVNSIPIGLLIFAMDEEKKTSIIAVNQPLVEFSNNVGRELDGKHRNWSQEELMLLFGQSIYCFCEDEDIHLVTKMLEESKTQGISNCTFRLRGSTEERPIWIFSSCCSKPGMGKQRNYYVSFQNVTEDEIRKREISESHEILLNLSYYDTLTGTRSRNYYNQFIEECRQNKLFQVGVAFADVNGLKHINDTLGHLYGDNMICKFANLLKTEFGPERVFRISGDEFVVVVSDIGKDKFFQRMKDVTEQAKQMDNIASIGYIWKDTVSDIKRRVSQAEQLMYLEKQKFYEEERTLESKHRTKMMGSLLSDLENGCYHMFLQPKSNIENQKVVGAEALVRKISASGEVIAPYEFVPQLESEKLIYYIDFFMLEEVCKFLQSLCEKGNTNFKISVNMSRVTMAENNYIQKIVGICDKYQFQRAQLEFEITESSRTMDNMRMEEDIKRLKELGFGVSLDDVGTEYSSFPMLTLEGIDTVKLDRSFIVKMKNEKVDKLISYVIEMSHDMGMCVIAEGVETDRERVKLMEKNCDMYQGYLLSKPIPAEEFKQRYL
ncbi:MAG: EAL domain-containing protein [Pararoseburia sp.]|nr:EAL domain-containing protein [Lachnospiraceae bacterium]MDY4793554.1 EAL domain-containing protein [Pararoseburia sp.]